MAQERDILLEIADLHAGFTVNGQFYPAVDRFSLRIKSGTVTGVVGESGCGKSAMALSVMGLLPKENGRLVGGDIWFRGRNIAGLSDDQMNRIRGKEIAMIFQEPMTALNPMLSIGFQLQEALRNHLPLSRKEARERSVALLKQVGIPRAEAMIGEYPHQLSGGMRQRVMIAMAIACGPKLLIADEPTTALDVSIQAQIVELLRRIGRQEDMSILLITHDLGVIAELADEVVVMYAGQIVEQSDVERIFHEPKHPYVKLLLQSIPRLDADRIRLESIAGVLPSLTNRRTNGCRFADRCPHAADICRKMEPLLADAGSGHYVRCFLYPGSNPANGREGES